MTIIAHLALLCGSPKRFLLCDVIYVYVMYQGSPYVYVFKHTLYTYRVYIQVQYFGNSCMFMHLVTKKRQSFSGVWLRNLILICHAKWQISKLYSESQQRQFYCFIIRKFRYVNVSLYRSPLRVSVLIMIPEHI